MIEHDVVIDAQVAIPEDLNEERVKSLLTHVLQEEGIEDEWALAIQFIDDQTMQSAHVEFMDIDEPTDIMTFPYATEDDVWGDDQAGGDLMISVDRARLNAAEAGWTELEELYFLVAHGLLHLMGWDDHSDGDRTNMLARQRQLLESWPDRDQLGLFT